MSKQPQQADTVDLKKARLMANYEQISQRWQETNDVFIRLCRRLQTTLEMDPLLDIFAEEVATVISFDSLSYQHESQGAHFVYTVGFGGRHRCEYGLTLEGEPFGTLTLNRRQRFAEQELSLLEDLLGLLVMSLRNAWRYHSMQQAALTDAATGLGNRRLLYQDLEREIHRAQRHGSHFSLILCDLDHFKRINDSYGHMAGDMVLLQIAGLMRQSVRSSDACFRFGGEEFAVLLPQTPLRETVQVAQRLSMNIDQHAFDIGGSTIKATVSLGVTAYAADQKAEEIIERADRALYEAKRRGRNQVVSDPVE